MQPLPRSGDDEQPPELPDAALVTAERRVAELVDGTVEGIPAEEVFRQLEHELEW